MNNTRFGLEIEFTGITRHHAVNIVAECLENKYSEKVSVNWNRHKAMITAPDGRVWAIVPDASILGYNEEGNEVGYRSQYACELVSPILTYDDIELVRTIAQEFTDAYAVVNSSCGIHIHLNGSDHDIQSVKNLINIISSKYSLFRSALGIEEDRDHYCKPIDSLKVEALKKCKDLEELEHTWYQGYFDDKNYRHHGSRYHFLNLHSFFTRNRTVELRGFNSSLDADEIESFIVFALAVNRQALSQKKSSFRINSCENKKLAMRNYLIGALGLKGDKYYKIRVHLMKKLNPNLANKLSRSAS